MAQPIDSNTAGAKQHNAYLPGYKPNHITNHAWRTAENSSAYLIPTLQSMAEANPKIQFLDCGTGPGTIAASFAKYIPEGQIMATDLSEEMVQRAAAHARAEGVTNMECQAASIYALPFADASFDVVHAQQVLCHLDAPVEALASMLRVCRPGGVVAARECDLRTWAFYPDTPGLRDFHELLAQTMEAAGGSSALGARLVALAMRAGAPRARIAASMGTWCYSTREERELWGGAMRDRIQEGEMRKKALADPGRFKWSEEELDAMGRAWDEWIAAEDGCLGCMHGQIIITK